MDEEDCPRDRPGMAECFVAFGSGLNHMPRRRVGPLIESLGQLAGILAQRRRGGANGTLYVARTSAYATALYYDPQGIGG
jgi:hypothetical protein